MAEASPADPGGYECLLEPSAVVEIGSPVSSILNLGANATLVMTLGDIQQVFVRGKVDEADVGSVHDGQNATFTVDASRDAAVADGRLNIVI